MKTIAVKIKVALLFALFGATALYGASAEAQGASSQSQEEEELCPLCEDAHNGNAEGIIARCGNSDASTIIDGQDVNERTALFRAARAEKEEIVALLLDAGPGSCGKANPNIPNRNRHTPLMAAAEKGNWRIGKKLFDAAEDQGIMLSLNADKRNRKTAADFAYEGEEAKHTEFLISLIARGGNFGRETRLSPDAISDFGEFFENRLSGSPSDALRAAASDGEALVVGVLLTIGVDAESADDQGRTPLMLAAKEGHHEVVSALLGDDSADVNVNARDNDDNTALHLAALHGKTLVVSVLLEERDLEVNLKNEDQKTALHLASEKGRHEVVSALVDDEHERLLVNEIDIDGKTALHLASEEGRHEVVSALFRDDSLEVNRKDNDGNAALHLASMDNKASLVVSVLLKKIATNVTLTNEAGETALEVALGNSSWVVVSVFYSERPEIVYDKLYEAATEGEVTVVSPLIEHTSLDVNRQGDNGNAALHLASMDNKASLVVSVLLRKIATNVTLTNDDGKTALDIALGNSSWVVVSVFYSERPEIVYDKLYEAATEGEVTVVSPLIEHTSLDVNRQGDNGNAALHLAALNNEASVVVALLSVNALNVTLTNDDGETALYIAAGKRYSGVVSAILDDNVDVGYPDLRKAAGEGQVTVVSALIGYSGSGLNVNETDADGNAALHLAASNNKAPVVSVLIEERSDLDVNLKNRAGYAALHIAAEKGYPNVASALFMASNLNDILTTDGGDKPVYLAAKENNPGVVAILVRNRSDAGYVELYRAAESNEPIVVSVLIRDENIDVNRRTRNNDTALHLGARGGHSGVVSVLVEYPGTLWVNSINTGGDTALHIAARGGFLPVVSALVRDENLDVNLTDRAGKTAVYIAAEERYSDVVFVLTGDDAASGHAALHKAAEIGGAVAVSVLIRDGNLNANHPNQYGNAALHIAAIEDQPGVAAVLVGYGSVNVNLTNSLGNSALHIAADRNRPSVVSVLVEHGRLSVNLVNRAGKTATDIAFSRRREIAISLIVRSNGVFKDHDVFSGSQVIDFLGSGDVNRSVAASVAAAILAAGNLNPAYGGQDTLFEWALSGGDGAGTLFFKPMFKDAAKKAGLDLDEREFDNQASYAARYHSFNSGSIESLLGRAAYYGRLNLVKFLYELGADINQTAPVIAFGWNWNFPAIWSAMYGNRMDVFTYLLTRDDYNDDALNGRGSLYTIHSASGRTHSGAPQMIDDLLARHPRGSRYFVNVLTLGESIVTPLWIATKGPAARGWTPANRSRFNYDGQRDVLETLFEYPIDMFQNLGFTRAIRIGERTMDLYMDHLEDNPDLVRNRANRQQIFDSIVSYTRGHVVDGYAYRGYSPFIIANLKEIISRLNDINLNCSSFTVPYNGGVVSFREYLRSILDADGASFVEEFEDILDQCPPEYEQLHVPSMAGASSSPGEATSKFIEIPEEDLEIPGLYFSEEPLEDFHEANQ